jgi:hypothetical protein
MARYSFHDLILEVQPDELESRSGLAGLWSNLSWVPAASEGMPFTDLSFRVHTGEFKVPTNGSFAFEADGVSGIEDHDAFYLSDGSSVFYLQPTLKQADAYLSPSFFDKSVLQQSNFWSFCLLKLLRTLGFFSLHAAGLVSPEGQGTLVVGAPGSGKSTLALGLIRNGWGFLSDDAVLVHRELTSVKALPLRRHFYIDANAAPEYCDLRLGKEVADNAGGWRRRVYVEDAYSGQQLAVCVPEVLIFTTIVSQEHSTLLPLNHVAALKHLLDGSGSQLFDRQAMGTHLETLKGLLRQSMSYHLSAGLDVYRKPSFLLNLMRVVKEEERCRALSSN